MLVKEWMSTKVVTIDSGSPLQEAINLLMEHNISMLPVMEDGRMVGIVTDRDVKRASPSDACLLDFQNIMYHVARKEVGSIMSKPPITVTLDHTIEETAEVLLQNGISGAPVVDEQGVIKGIITKDDLFSALISLSGLSHKGVLFGFQLEDQPGSIKEVTDAIRACSGRLASIVSTYETAPQGHRYVYIRAFDLDAESIAKLQEEFNQKGILLFKVDLSNNKREFFRN
ncbi:MAG: CBS domain-containing protein [Desulfomonile tiedjei]|uniref:CBS domain-containing protein n=1 Tax=Desulfomonile tiedjei TaxID=2358 RepID=A0A9D6Z1S2_9BACT|nr:CBS domain-containing protein [Desulfomonile tiedjei]